MALMVAGAYPASSRCLFHPAASSRVTGVPLIHLAKAPTSRRYLFTVPALLFGQKIAEIL